jgi:hypothetical protein
MAPYRIKALQIATTDIAAAVVLARATSVVNTKYYR